MLAVVGLEVKDIVETLILMMPILDLRLCLTSKSIRMRTNRPQVAPRAFIINIVLLFSTSVISTVIVGDALSLPVPVGFGLSSEIVGVDDGAIISAKLGFELGNIDGEVVGCFVGRSVGLVVGVADGEVVGRSVGPEIGDTDGEVIGGSVGAGTGDADGFEVGGSVGAETGDTDGFGVGNAIGGVGKLVGKFVGEEVGQAGSYPIVHNLE